VVQLEIQARFGDVDDDSYVLVGALTEDSGWAPEFVLGCEWVTVEFHEQGATMRVKGQELHVASDGTWHEGKLLGILVRGRLHQDVSAYREWPPEHEAPKY
jgi:hypothetical protein